ncbi:MAG: metallophosphoesterase family protein, partial [Planctomycetota bacterium]
MNRRIRLFYFLSISCLAFVLCFSACDLPMFTDMPQLEYEEEEPVEIQGGPYLGKLTPFSAVICFTTDKKVSAGLSILNNDKKKLIRSGREKTFHAVEVKGLKPGSSYDCEILIKNGPDTTFSFTTYPEKYDEVKVAFITDGEQDQDKIRSALNIIDRKGIGTIVFLGSQVKKRSLWLKEIFAPYREQLEGLTVIHSPELFDLPEELFPGYPLRESYSVDLGPMYIIMVSESDLRSNNLFRFEPWFLKELKNAGNRWKIVVMPEKLLNSGPNGINTGMIEKWAPELEKHNVDFVMTVDPRFYHRSLPIGAEHKGIRYISLPSLSPDKTPASPSDFTAAQSGEPAFFVLNTTRLGRIEGRNIKLNSRIDDGFVLEYKKRGKKSFFLDRKKMVTGAWAEYSQKKELKTIVRQACKAVTNPARPGKLKIVINNPSPLPFKGTLNWLADDAVFYVIPESVKFDLQPGEGIRSTFEIHQNKAGGRMPLLIANTDSGYKAKGRMFLTWRQEFKIKRTKEQYNIDGVTDEDFWKQATAVTDFTSMNGGKLKNDPPIAWVIAGDKGLRVRFRCPAAEGTLQAAKISEH